MKKILGIILIISLAGLASCATKEASENTDTTIDKISNTQVDTSMQDESVENTIDDGMMESKEGVMEDTIDEDAMMEDTSIGNVSMGDDLPSVEETQEPSIEEQMMDEITDTIATTGSTDSTEVK